MEKIVVNVAWCDKNFGASFGDNVPGAVVFTAPTFEECRRRRKKRSTFTQKDSVRMVSKFLSG